MSHVITRVIKVHPRSDSTESRGIGLGSSDLLISMLFADLLRDMFHVYFNSYEFHFFVAYK